MSLSSFAKLGAFSAQQLESLALATPGGIDEAITVPHAATTTPATNSVEMQ